MNVHSPAENAAGMQWANQLPRHSAECTHAVPGRFGGNGDALEKPATKSTSGRMAINLTRIDELALITLDRPELLNALNFELLRDFGAEADLDTLPLTRSKT